MNLDREATQGKICGARVCVGLLSLTRIADELASFRVTQAEVEDAKISDWQQEREHAREQEARVVHC